MDTCKEKWTLLELRVFSLLCRKAGEKLSQREIARELAVSPTAVAAPVRNLVKRRLARAERTRNVNLVSFSREERSAIELKRVENLRAIYLSGLAEYLENELPGGTVVLFGSYSRGEDVASSDIDVAVVGRKDKPLALEKYEKALGRLINVNFYDSWNGIERHLRNNILGGIVLQGGVAL